MLLLPCHVGTANDSTKATDRLLWAVNSFGEVLAQVGIHHSILLLTDHVPGVDM